MRVLVECLADTASVNIARHVKAARPWKEAGRFDGRPVLRHGELALATIEAMHIHDEDVDARLRGAGVDATELVFLSRHRSESGTPTLTAHPIGNWHEAKYGGRPATVCPPAPLLLAGLLRALFEAAPRGYGVSLEATHHGPHTSVPSVFVEVGSSEANWNDEAACAAVASAVLAPAPSTAPAVVCIGGGHYGPRFTDATRRGAIAPGHILPDHAAAKTDAATLQAAQASIPGCAGMCLDPKAGAASRRLAAALQEAGVPEVPLAQPSTP